MQIHYDTQDDAPESPHSRYPSKVTLISLALKPVRKSKATQFAGFSVLHVHRLLDRGAIIFTQRIHTCVSFDAKLQTNLGIDLVRALQPHHKLAGLYLGRSLQALTLHAMKADPSGFAPAIIGLCHASRQKPPIEIDTLYGRPDITATDINRVVGPSAAAQRWTLCGLTAVRNAEAVPPLTRREYRIFWPRREDLNLRHLPPEDRESSNSSLYFSDLDRIRINPAQSQRLGQVRNRSATR